MSRSKGPIGTVRERSGDSEQCREHFSTPDEVCHRLDVPGVHGEEEPRGRRAQHPQIRSGQHED